MDVNNVSPNIDIKPAANSLGNTTNKPVLVAYNDVKFGDFIDKGIGTSQFDTGKKLTGGLDEQRVETKRNAFDNIEYRGFVENAERKPHTRNIISAKRRLKSFQPIPVGKHRTSSVDVGRDIDIKNNKLEKPEIQFERFAGKSKDESLAQQIKEYKEDQLLSNPGGDNFFLNRKTNVIDNNFDQTKFSNRVGKDLYDSVSNLKNMVKDMGFGSELKYFDSNGNIKTKKKTGFLGTITNLAKDVASGITLGAYTPANEEAPVGAMGKVKHLFKKVFVDAIGKDMFVGVPQSVINVGEDALFAGLNLVEAIPDATIGNTKGGRELTTRVFDNVQVAMDFATDIMPGGEASTRMKLLVAEKIKDLKNGENEPQGVRKQYVRNSKFRKAIETLSFFMPFRI